MLYFEKPQDFNPSFEIGSCFVEHEGEILLLKRQDHKPQGGTYGVPAGKIHRTDKSSLHGTQREMGQETGIQMPLEKITHFKTVYVRYQEYDFIYHMYHALVNGERPEIKISPEHTGSKWISPVNALDLPLIQDLDECIRLFYKI